MTYLSGLRGVDAATVNEARRRVEQAMKKGETPDLSDLNLEPAEPVPTATLLRSPADIRAEHGKARLLRS